MQTQPQQQQQQQVEKYLANPLLETIQSGQWVGSNEEILKSITDLRTLLSEERMTNPELSQQGLGISSAIDRVLRSSQKFITEKNSDEAFQKFFNHAIEFGKIAKNEIELSKGKNNPTALELNERFSDIVDMLRQLVFQIFTSKKERDIVRNVQVVLEKFHGTFGDMERVNLEDIPKDKRDDLVKTLLNFYAGCEKIPGVKELRNNILSIFDFMTEGLKTIRPDFANEFVLLFDEALTVLDRFTEKNVFVLKTKVMTAFQLISKDKESVEYFTKMRRLSDELINNPKLVHQPETVKKVNDVLEKYVNIRNKFYPQLKDVYSYLKEIFLSLQEERYLSDIKFGFGGIGERLRSGSYLGTLIQLKTILAPILTAGLKNAELKPIKQEDETSSWTLSNIHLAREENNLDDIVVTAKIGLKDVLKVKLSIKKIDLHFKDVNFNYERYSVPSWTDSGKLDIRMTSPSWKLKWIVNQKEGRDPFFELQVAQTSIKNLDIEVTKANHTWIDSLLLQLWAPSIRRGAQDSIERLLREKAMPLTQKLNQFFATRHTSKAEEEGRQVLPKAATQTKKLGGEATQVAEKNVY